MSSLTKEKLLALKPTVKKVDIPALGYVYVKSLNELTRSRRISEMFDDKGRPNKKAQEERRARLIIDQICDKNGDPMFTSADLEDILKLDGLSLDAIINAILGFNEDLEGNALSE